MGVCTNKQERLAVDLLRKINLEQYFEYIAGCDTFDFNKPDSRHLTNVIEIIGGDIKKSIMIGDSEVDSLSAYNAKIPSSKIIWCSLQEIVSSVRKSVLKSYIGTFTSNPSRSVYHWISSVQFFYNPTIQKYGVH